MTNLAARVASSYLCASYAAQAAPTLRPLGALRVVSMWSCLEGAISTRLR